jgi:Glyoxalase-like domain
VAHLEPAARELGARFGLASVEGGRHPGWGTANRIVPLGGSYLELIAVVDEAGTAQSSFGRWIAATSTPAGRPIGWAVRADRLDDVARGLDLTVAAGSRVAPSGRLLTWRLAGVEQAVAEPSLPFFIEWGPGTPLPGRARVAHPAGNVEIVGLELTGDAGRLADWLGGEQLPVTVHPGGSAVTRVVLAGDDGEIVLAG